MAIWLFILYLITTLTRQFLEPKIVSDSFGIHPLFTLTTMCACYGLFGVKGLLLGALLVMRAITELGKEARTAYKPLEVFKHHTLLELRLFTGRTHQIRVHLAHIGHPIIGDHLYGNPCSGKVMDRQALHCCEMMITKVDSQDRLIFNAPIPEDIQEVIDLFRAMD